MVQGGGNLEAARGVTPHQGRWLVSLVAALGLGAPTIAWSGPRARSRVRVARPVLQRLRSRALRMVRAAPARWCLRTFNRRSFLQVLPNGRVAARGRACSRWETFAILDLNGGRLLSGDRVQLRAHTGRYLKAHPNGRLDTGPNHRQWETFELVAPGKRRGALVGAGARIALRSWHRRFVTAEGGGGGVARANRRWARGWETFTLVAPARGRTAPARAVRGTLRRIGPRAKLVPARVVRSPRARPAPRLAMLEGTRFVELHPSWNRPDLAVTAVRTTSVLARPGARVEVSAVVTNRGTGPSASAVLVLFEGARELGRTRVGGLSPNASATARWPWIVPRGAARAVLRVKVDLRGRYDGNYRNNTRSATVRIAGAGTGRPDLRVEAVAAAALRLAARRSEQLPIVVRNLGSAARSRSVAVLSIDGRETWRGEVARLGSGDESSMRVPVPGMRAGEHLLSLHIGKLATVKTWHVVVPAPSSLGDSSPQHRWISVGPSRLDDHSTGRMDSLAFDPRNPKILYAGAAVSGSGGLWKSTDAGRSWTSLTNRYHLPCMNVGAVAVDPRRPRIVYFSTGSSRYGRGCGIFKSTDGGASWYHFFRDDALLGGASDLTVRYLASGEQVIYAGGNKGLLRYRSKSPLALTSGSSEWKRIRSGLIIDMAVSPKDANLVYASVLGDGLYRSRGGATAAGNGDWEKLTKGLPKISSDKQLLQLDIWRGNPMILYAAISHPLGVGAGGIEQNLPRLGVYMSVNGGASWSWQFWGDNTRKSLYNPFIRIHPRDPQTVFYGGVWLFKRRTGSTAKSIRITGIHDDMHELLFDPARSDYFYILSDGGIFSCRAAKSDDCHHRNDGLQTLQIFDLDSSAKRSNVLIAGTQDNGTVLDGGHRIWRLIRTGDGYHSLIARDDDRVMYSQYQNLNDTQRTADVWRTPVQWAAANGKLPSRSMGSGYLTIHPSKKDYLVTAGDPVYFTTNGGKSWTARGPRGSKLLSRGIPYAGRVVRVLIQPRTGAWVAGTEAGQVWITEDEGRSWALMFQQGEGNAVASMAFSPRDHRVLFVAFDKAGVQPRKVFRAVQNPSPSADPRWQALPIANGFPANRTPQSIAGDAWDWRRVYVGTGHGVFRGVYQGAARGWTWAPFNKGLPLADVRDLLVNRVSRRLIAATYGNGVWQVDTRP